jgi:hypothetical protein
MCIVLITILIVVNLIAFIGGVVLSLTTREQPRRRRIRIATVVLSLPLLLVLAGLVSLWYLFGKEPPTLAELQQDFLSKRADLELILRMSDEDADFSRIAPDFLDRTPDSPNGMFRYMRGDPKAGLAEARWDAYRSIYRRNDIRLGIPQSLARRFHHGRFGRYA